MTTLVVEKSKLPEVVREWLVASELEDTLKMEVHFLAGGEMIIRPRSVEQEELSAWLDAAIEKYGDVLRRLADS